MAKTKPPGNLTGFFKERLYQARTQQGWSQSELARQVWGEIEDSRGYKVAKNRDRISAYERGKSVPERHNLEAMAAVFGVPPEELAPDLTAERAAAEGKTPAIRMTMLEDQQGVVRLQVDLILPLATASQIIAYLSEAGVA
jgi:transcriptional regulator with XRE-family HTH domain